MWKYSPTECFNFDSTVHYDSFFWFLFYYDSFVLRNDKYNTYKTKGRHPVSFPLQRQNQEARHSPEMSADDNKQMLKLGDGLNNV